MSRPMTTTQSFDTSVIDTQRSFSSTETDTSGSLGSKSNVQSTTSYNELQLSKPVATSTVTNDELYNQWAATYDTDGNVLQAVDDLQMHELLPEFMRLVQEPQPRSPAGLSIPKTHRLLDLGCGTGRNTTKLAQAATLSGDSSNVEIIGWDASAAMLDIARAKLTAAPSPSTKHALPQIQLRVLDFSNPGAIPTSDHRAFDGVISTLVLEHLSLQTYFSVVSSLLRQGGVALVTNMHAEMGEKTSAGFKDAKDGGRRLRGESYTYTVAETVEAAEREGLKLIGGGKVKEIAIDEDMIARGEVGERGWKWVGRKVWFGGLFGKV